MSKLTIYGDYESINAAQTIANAEKRTPISMSAELSKLKVVNALLVEALKDAEFLLRKLSINWKEAGAMTDSIKRSAEQARAALSRAQEE